MALIQILTAAPKAGKTQAALSLAGDRAVFFTPSPKDQNPDFDALPWVWGHDIKAPHLPELLKRYKRFRVVMLPGESKAILPLFMDPIFEGWTFVFNDFPALFPRPAEADQYAIFAVGIRHREGKIIVATHRVSGILPTLARSIADEITQVGPLIAQDEAATLYVMGGSASYPTRDAFYQAISKNPKYRQFPVKSA